MPPNEAETVAASAATKMDPETEPLNAGAAADPKVKFIGGSENVDVEKGAGTAKESGIKEALTKSELMKYASDPFWVKLRWFLFILFWVGWLAMLVASVAIIVLAPKCPSPSPKQWWQKYPVYEVYVKSFKDSDGDGVGDLEGVKSKVDYLADLGVGSVWLSPIYKSPMVDNGYDVSDYKDVDPSFGTLQNFKDLVAALHEKNMKVIMDFIPNHSSDKHEWFAKSVKKEEPYTDYYVWADGKNGGPPSNWKSVFEDSAWTFNAERGQYYLHQFYKEQPDLNLRNPKVVEEMTNVMKFWLELGVDGFRVDSVAHFFEDTTWADEESIGSGGYESLKHDKTYDLPEVTDLLQSFRAVLDEATGEGEPRIMMTEAYLSGSKVGRYYGNVSDQRGDLSHLPLNFNLLSDFESQADFNAKKLNESIYNYLKELPNKAWPNFCLGNHDHDRVATRLGPKNVDAMNILLMALQGTPFTYYGEEIGMVDGSGGSGKRDAYRTPMQWSDAANAGFSDGSPWLPINNDYTTTNVATSEATSESHLSVFKQAVGLRDLESILFGKTQMNSTENAFLMSRIRKGNPGYLYASNFGDTEVTVSVSKFNHIASQGTLKMAVPMAEYLDGASINLQEFKLDPHQTLIVEFVPKF